MIMASCTAAGTKQRLRAWLSRRLNDVMTRRRGGWDRGGKGRRDMVTATVVSSKSELPGSFFFYNPNAVPISNHAFSATTTTTMTHPVRFTKVVLTSSPIDVCVAKISSAPAHARILKPLHILPCDERVAVGSSPTRIGSQMTQQHCDGATYPQSSKAWKRTNLLRPPLLRPVFPPTVEERPCHQA